MFYYLVVCYDTHNCSLEEESDLHGPFTTDPERTDDVRRELKEWDSDGSVILNITLMKMEDGKLVKESSTLVGYDEWPEDDESEDDSDEDDKPYYVQAQEENP